MALFLYAIDNEFVANYQSHYHNRKGCRFDYCLLPEFNKRNGVQPIPCLDTSFHDLRKLELE